MGQICSKCGLPQELCVCETIAKESQKVLVKIEKRKFGKKYTVINGIDTAELSLEDLTKLLKSKLACGGTAKRDHIELQGDHTREVKRILINQGFAAESIEINDRGKK
jgi:translation initiation factor 1